MPCCEDKLSSKERGIKYLLIVNKFKRIYIKCLVINTTMSTLLVRVKEVFFSTGFKWKNSQPYRGKLPPLEKTEPGWRETDG